MTAPRRDPVALTVQERGRAASQQELTTATTLLAAIDMLTQCGRANRIRGASSRYAACPAHSERASPSQPRGTARSHHAANARSWLDKELRSRGHRRPQGDTTTMLAPSATIPAHVLLEPTRGAPQATCCQGGGLRISSHFLFEISSHFLLGRAFKGRGVAEGFSTSWPEFGPVAALPLLASGLWVEL